MADTRAHAHPGSTTSYRWIILIFAILAYSTSQFARQNYGGVQKFIAADFNLDRAALGLLGSVFFYAYALFQVPWGIASDRFGNRGVTALGLFLIAFTMAGFATSQSEGAPPVLAVCRRRCQCGRLRRHGGRVGALVPSW